MKKTRVSLIVASLLTSALLSTSSFAAEPAWQADFRKADLNDSGGLSILELDKSGAASLKPLKDNFSAIDTDKDGQLTVAEYEHYLAATGEKFAAKFKKADLNDSGGLSRKELDKQKDKDFDTLKKNFDVIDGDKDGQVTLTEYHAWMTPGNVGTAGVAAAPLITIPKDHCQPDCGVVVDVDRYKTEGDASMMGTIAGGVAGGVLGNQVGKGTGKTVATIGGAAGGAYVGRALEKKLKTKKMVKIVVKRDNGEQQEFHIEADKSPYARGERVQIKEDGQLMKYTGM